MPLFEYWETGVNTYYRFYSTFWKCQTFTTISDHNVNKVGLYLYREGSPGTLTVSIRATADGVPTGDDLCSGTYDSSLIGTEMEWVTIDMTTSIKLTASTIYAIIIRVADSDISNSLEVGTFSGGYDYTDGFYMYSVDSGASWLISAQSDLTFEIWGLIPSSKAVIVG